MQVDVINLFFETVISTKVVIEHRKYQYVNYTAPRSPGHGHRIPIGIGRNIKMSAEPTRNRMFNNRFVKSNTHTDSSISLAQMPLT